MINFKKGFAVAALSLMLPMAAMSSGSAAPLRPDLSLSGANAQGTAQNPLVTNVYWRGRGYGYRGGWGWGGAAAGLAAGAIIGGAIAAGSAPYYGYGPGYYYGGPAYYPAPAYGGDEVAYCMRRYKSYDPASGTFLGYDGLRHPCP